MCPTGALTFGDLNDPDSEVSRLVAEKKPYSSRPEFGLKENVLYLNIPRKFVTGTVVFKETDRCAKDIKVVLKGNGAERRVETDVFGDFWFDGLESRTEYTVHIEAAGYKKISITPHILNDVDLGEIFLETE
jgi:hypothetical protein